jgi:hypothetical protein
MQQLTHEGRMFTHKNYNMKNVQYDCKFKRGYGDVRVTSQEALAVEKYQSTEGRVRPLELASTYRMDSKARIDEEG